MRCPRDGAHLSTVEIDSVQMEQCPTCEGLWLDSGELQSAWKLDDSHVESDLHPAAATSHDDQAGVAAYMRCPRCPEGRLQSVDYSYLHPIKIDRCDRCLGVWLDKGELDAIVVEKRRLDAEFSVDKLKALLRSKLG